MSDQLLEEEDQQDELQLVMNMHHHLLHRHQLLDIDCSAGLLKAVDFKLHLKSILTTTILA